MKRAKKPPLPKVRNPVARAPILGKGGPHGKTTRARRREANVETRNLAREPHVEE